jgi:hypothetical protein
MSEDECSRSLSTIRIEPFKESVFPPGDWGFGGIDLAVYMTAVRRLAQDGVADPGGLRGRRGWRGLQMRGHAISCRL